MAQPAREQRVSEAFVALADTLVDDYDVIDLLDQLVGHAWRCWPWTPPGSCSPTPVSSCVRWRRPARTPRPWSCCSCRPTRARAWTAYRSGAQVRVLDCRRRRIGGRGSSPPSRGAAAFASVHAIPLRLRGQAIGALNLFHREPGPLPDADLALGQALADVATIGILQERAIRRGEVLNEQLQTALNSRVDHRAGQGRAGPTPRGWRTAPAGALPKNSTGRPPGWGSGISSSWTAHG